MQRDRELHLLPLHIQTVTASLAAEIATVHSKPQASSPQLFHKTDFHNKVLRTTSLGSLARQKSSSSPPLSRTSRPSSQNYTYPSSKERNHGNSYTVKQQSLPLLHKQPSRASNARRSEQSGVRNTQPCKSRIDELDMYIEHLKTVMESERQERVARSRNSPTKRHGNTATQQDVMQRAQNMHSHNKASPISGKQLPSQSHASRKPGRMQATYPRDSPRAKSPSTNDPHSTKRTSSPKLSTYVEHTRPAKGAPYKERHIFQTEIAYEQTLHSSKQGALLYVSALNKGRAGSRNTRAKVPAAASTSLYLSATKRIASLHMRSPSRYGKQDFQVAGAGSQGLGSSPRTTSPSPRESSLSFLDRYSKLQSSGGRGTPCSSTYRSQSSFVTPPKARSISPYSQCYTAHQLECDIQQLYTAAGLPRNPQAVQKEEQDDRSEMSDFSGIASSNNG